MKDLNCGLFQKGDIACIIGDDSDHGSGRVAYSGLWSLVSRKFVHTVFAPPYAGLIAHTHRKTRPVFTRLGDDKAKLHSSYTYTRRNGGKKVPIESEATFNLCAPHYIDYEYWFRAKEKVEFPLPHYLELTWCNYVNAVPDPAIYFVGEGKWTREYSPSHGYKSLFFPKGLLGSEEEKLPVKELLSKGKPVPWSWSPNDAVFDLPFYYGRVHHMLLLFMFDKYLDWRFYISPSGGGGTPLGPGYHNPAWDWSWVIRDITPYKKYSCNIRVVYKPFKDDNDVIEEYKNWKYSTDDLLDRCSLTK